MTATMESQAQQQRPTPAKAAGLTNILNQDDQPSVHSAPLPQLRDSGFYSTTDASSKHTSAASFSVNGLSPTASGYQSSSADKTPSPVAANMMPQALVSPSASNMSVASMVSPTSPVSVDQRRFNRPTSLESQPPPPNGATLGESLAAGVSLVRRESVDSRINQGFSDMRLGGSPYTTNNQSTSSIQNTLHSQRNPRPGFEALAMHRISNGYQPSADRNPEPKTVKTAPAITGPATGHIARAAEPTKGQAWAFPEEDMPRLGPGRYNDSRRSSITESVASSQFTTESRLPPGQRRLDDGSDHIRLPHHGDFPPVHHHTMQHKQLSDLQAEEGGGPTGSQPYSRTPELRVSHKLAERKRRTEMKELFDQLRDLMPQERGSKASKWEILTKAIAEHQKMVEHIRLLQSHCNTTAAELDMLRRENHNLRMEAAGHGQQGAQQQQQQQQQQPQQPHTQPQQSQQSSQPASYAGDPYSSASRTELPPLRSISNSIPSGPDSMTGVQYEPPRVNGYRHESGVAAKELQRLCQRQKAVRQTGTSVLQVHDPRSRVGFVVAFLTGLPTQLARDSALPFMHPRLWASSLPRPLVAVYSAAAAHSTRSSLNRAWTARLIADACRDVLREGTVTMTTADDDDDDDDDEENYEREKLVLARVQALTIANAIRVFDGDVALGAAAEREMAVLVAWLKDLVVLRDRLEERAGHAGGRPLRHLPPDSWESWIFLESVRRTIVTASSFMSIVYLLRSEQPAPGMWIERQCFTASKHLWEAASSVDFYRAWREKPHYWVENLGFGDLWMYARPTDLDEFTRLMLTPYVGVDAMEHFMEGDVFMPR
ncbi:hypothetical protein L249_5810 [Ophiocordyceps polyrhachis-furcata BCC 54312]|uniref:BHLH domain-containing protein n=1 Tax=Ophiocordyceps polyrhachis-furcata BCC 54312 TaxID=1330021 RepID=A0A367L0A2_9HYPO|nr:hypothetical protein L249_5810 [Ophiocordyceps polyrhachis-furcata BCC 54312]